MRARQIIVIFTEKNMTRTYNEYVDIRKHFFDEMSDVVFKKTFGKIFKK